MVSTVKVAEEQLLLSFDSKITGEGVSEQRVISWVPGRIFAHGPEVTWDVAPEERSERVGSGVIMTSFPPLLSISMIN